jgi:spore maturation protein A
MLNYVFGGMVVLSLVFALWQDGADLTRNTWRNGEIIRLEVVVRDGSDIRFRIDGDSTVFRGDWRPDGDRAELVVPVTETLPDHWKSVAANQESSRKQELRTVVVAADTTTASITLPPVRFVKLRAITKAAFDMAETAVTLALGLIGVMAFWLGLMKIAESSGIIQVVVKGVRPFMRRLFPTLPADHPALGYVSLNLAANVLGLGNAATPMGLKAMEELQALNPDKETASDPMIMFLALNTSSVQILPPVTLVALMGLKVNELFFSILIATTFSTIAAITAVKWMERRSRRTEVA